jgi:GxxExxY protein
MDLVCFGAILVELKAKESVGENDAAQVIHYLKASRLPIGLLANFGEPSLRIQRFVGETFRQPASPSSVGLP